MVYNDQSKPELAPSGPIQNLPHRDSGWFEHLVQVYPHHTDYGGIVWHGTYIAWMEEARVESLRSIGIDYADWVTQGLELPVVELSVRYHRAVQMGQTVAVRTRMSASEGVRLLWDYEIQSPDGKELYVSAQVTLVGVDREKGKIMRQLPVAVQEALAKLTAHLSP
ncbi:MULTISPECIES: acyl-CoA thioesterase [Kamptonema]|uniref:acyl-CoA thioesterase n=1 Tax=Kamptonema TaxID=1501433 RepID=UPI0001DAD1A2|nr:MULTISPECIES: thioesterase family protein [Kamptonema]CBN55189.1 4-hydroxybenzoyl-CoA thioesterase [Kamptonema sp. PCC 6506]